MDKQQPDVFFSYNNADEALVLEVYTRVIARGLTVWLDKPNMRVGFPWIRKMEEAITTSASAAILIGLAGIGPTQQLEVQKCIEEYTKRQIPIIPVLLPGAPAPQNLTHFLSGFQAVSMQGGITDEGVERLVWGVLGVSATEVNRELIVNTVREQERQRYEEQFVDPMGIAALKSRLHALSEIIAQASVQCATYAAKTFPDDTLAVVLPVAVEMRWRRGYASAIEKILRIPESQKRIIDLTCEEVAGGCTATEGILSARPDDDGRVLVLLEGQPAAWISGFKAEDRDSILESIELHGRLGVPSRGGMSIVERIGEVPILVGRLAPDELSAVLFQNREVLAPILARLRIPELEWLLAEDENYSSILPTEPTQSGPIPPLSLPQSAGVKEETFNASSAVTSLRSHGMLEDVWDLLRRSAGFGGLK